MGDSFGGKLETNYLNGLEDNEQQGHTGKSHVHGQLYNGSAPNSPQYTYVHAYVHTYHGIWTNFTRLHTYTSHMQ